MKTATKTTTNNRKALRAACDPKPAELKTAPPKSAVNVARQIYASVKERLEGEFERFVRNSAIEEKRLLTEILNDHDNRSGLGTPRHPGEYEVPLYGAIQRQLDACICVVIPCDDMVPKVEAFISALERKQWRRTPADHSRQTADEICDGMEVSFRSEYELFAQSAGRPSLMLMRAILARWNELSCDPELKALPNVLEVAAEIELEKLRVETAADNAKAA